MNRGFAVLMAVFNSLRVVVSSHNLVDGVLGQGIVMEAFTVGRLKNPLPVT